MKPLVGVGVDEARRRLRVHKRKDRAAYTLHLCTYFAIWECGAFTEKREGVNKKKKILHMPRNSLPRSFGFQ